jgi:hypothetical protein
VAGSVPDLKEFKNFFYFQQQNTGIDTVDKPPEKILI